MMQYEIFAPYIYWKSVGKVWAETEEEALEKAWDELEIEDADSLCFHCEEDMIDHPMLDLSVDIHAECLGEK